MKPWRLTYPGCDLAFGTRSTGYSFTAWPSLDDSEGSSDDAVRPRSDGTFFGRDFLRGGVIGFEFAIWDGQGIDAMRGLRDRFKAAWRADVVRGDPGRVAQLMAPSGRSVFGRPRSVVEVRQVRREDVSLYRAEFVLGDPTWYGPSQSVQAPLTPAVTRGLSAPLVAPLTTDGLGIARRSVTVAGDVVTPVRVDVAGPISSPRVQVGPVVVELQGAIAEGQTVTVDGRVRSISYGSRLTSASTPLSRMLLEPGRYEVVLTGQSASAAAGVTVSWRDGFASY